MGVWRPRVTEPGRLRWPRMLRTASQGTESIDTRELVDTHHKAHRRSYERRKAPAMMQGPVATPSASVAGVESVTLQKYFGISRYLYRTLCSHGSTTLRETVSICGEFFRNVGTLSGHITLLLGCSMSGALSEFCGQPLANVWLSRPVGILPASELDSDRCLPLLWMCLADRFGRVGM